MSNERRIKALKLRQKSLVASFVLIKEFVDDYDETTQAVEIPVRLERLIQIWSDYDQNQRELETLDDTAIDVYLKERTALETSYYRIKGFLLAQNKATITELPSSPNQLALQVPPSASQVRLPDVKLPVFEGKLENWLNFHDLYVALVHSSTGLSNIQKFYYLRSSLSHEALQLIQTIPISANNYLVAWNLLLDHFQNPARLKQSYVDSLFDFASLTRESATELHSLVEKFEANVKVLQQLGERTEYWDLLLIRMLSTRLDSTTRRDWEEYSSTLPVATYRELITFIQRRVTVLHSVQARASEISPPVSTKKQSQRPIASNGASQVSYRKCVVCTDHHPLYLCERFSQLPLEDKEEAIRHHQLCRNCLRKGHQSKECMSSSNCRRCRGRHHTQLCQDTLSSSESQATSSQQPIPTASPSTSVLPINSNTASVVESVSYASTGASQRTVLLATATIIIVDDEGNHHIARALLDSGSERCFISERFAERIKAQKKRIHLPISGIGQATTHARMKFLSRIQSRVGEYSTNIEFIVLPRVTVHLPATSIDTSMWDIPPGIDLADPTFDSSKPVDVVIGAEIFFDLFRVPGRIPLGENLPVLINSVFGWVVCGKSDVNLSTPIIAHIAIVAHSTVPTGQKQLRSFEEHNEDVPSAQQNNDWQNTASINPQLQHTPKNPQCNPAITQATSKPLAVHQPTQWINNSCRLAQRHRITSGYGYSSTTPTFTRFHYPVPRKTGLLHRGQQLGQETWTSISPASKTSIHSWRISKQFQSSSNQRQHE